MELGRRKWGVPRCRKDSGCDKPAPVLDAMDFVAFEIFRRCLRQWHKVGDPMTGYRRDRLDYSAVREVADSMGIELTDPLLCRIADCQEWALAEDRRNQKAPPPATRPEMVN